MKKIKDFLALRLVEVFRFIFKQLDYDSCFFIKVGDKDIGYTWGDLDNSDNRVIWASGLLGTRSKPSGKVYFDYSTYLKLNTELTELVYKITLQEHPGGLFNLENCPPVIDYVYLGHNRPGTRLSSPEDHDYGLSVRYIRHDLCKEVSNEEPN